MSRYRWLKIGIFCAALVGYCAYSVEVYKSNRAEQKSTVSQQ